MELKRLIANDSKSALQSVKDECGDNALIVSTNKVGKKTEVIYAVDISTPAPEEDFQKTHGRTPRFSDALGEIEKRQSTQSSDVRKLLGQIQNELGSLKHKIDSQNLNFPKLEKKEPSKASDLALQSLKVRVQKLMEVPLEEQKAWSGIQLFTGKAISGKTSCLSRLAYSKEVSFNGTKGNSFAIICLASDDYSSRAFLPRWQQLGELATRDKAPIFTINNISDLNALIEGFASKRNLLIDVNTTSLLSERELIDAIKKYDIQVNYCLSASAPDPIIRELSIIQDQIASMSCICSVTECDDIDQMIERMAINNCQISAINQVSDLELF